MLHSIKTGTRVSEHGTYFCVWAPLAKKMELVILGEEESLHELEKDMFGYWHADINGITAGTRYLYRINGEKRRPDPCSFFQKEGVHGPSTIVDFSGFSIASSPKVAPHERIFYEIHVGTFTGEGTFYSAAEKIGYLKELGVTCIEIMPVSAFPGIRNWGYDGVFHYAVQESYGGPEGLAYFVDACHKEGLQVYLDVVYNHLGPEGNYLSDFAPYFTSKYITPWGEAMNFDGEYSYGVRKFILDNALHWFCNYKIDGLRLDAVHGIFDMSARHILKELSQEIEHYAESSGTNPVLTAESDLNDRKITDKVEENGYGIDLQWLEDFHHCVHSLLTKEKRGYYKDFGSLEDLGFSLNKGFVYNWRYSHYRKKFFGSDSRNIDPSKFIVFIQNHDQVGNRLNGDRLGALLDFDTLKLAAGVLLLSPYTPLLFMGEEYGEKAPFYYFIDHGDKHLCDAVRKGRKREFRGFRFKGEFPDPASKDVYEQSCLDKSLLNKPEHKQLFLLYKELISFRRSHPAYKGIKRKNAVAYTKGSGLLFLQIKKQKRHFILVVFNFSSRPLNAKNSILPGGSWSLLLDSSKFDGMLKKPKKLGSTEMLQIPAKSFLLLTR